MFGFGDYTPNHDKPDLLQSGITVIEKGAIIPSETKIGRNSSSYIKNKEIPSGSTLV